MVLMTAMVQYKKYLVLVLIKQRQILHKFRLQKLHYNGDEN